MHPFLEIAGLRLPAYGASIAVGILLCYALASWLGKRTELGSDHATTLFLVSIFAAFLGSKGLGFIVEGRTSAGAGGVFLGGLIMVFVGLVITARILKRPVALVLDVLAPVGMFGHFFGRMGCLFVGCCYGRPTDSDLGVHFVEHSVAYDTLRLSHPALIEGTRTAALVPTQLIEASYELLLAGLFIALLLRRPPRGLVVGLYLMCYAVFRFFIEYYRFDLERGFLFGKLLSTSQFISLLLLVLAGLGTWWFVLRPARREPGG